MCLKHIWNSKLHSKSCKDYGIKLLPKCLWTPWYGRTTQSSLSLKCEMWMPVELWIIHNPHLCWILGSYHSIVVNQSRSYKMHAVQITQYISNTTKKMQYIFYARLFRCIAKTGLTRKDGAQPALFPISYLCCSTQCLYVNAYCSTATRCQPNCS